MGAKEQGFFKYIESFPRYADLMNGTVFDGKQVVKPEYLRKMPRKKSVLVGTYTENATQRTKSSYNDIRYLKRERDMLMLYDEKYSRFYLACEVQLYADYAMPLRNFTYDGVEYSDQIKAASMTNKEDCHDKRTKGPSRPLIPVIHNVLYLGEKRWMSKHGLQEMMDIPKILRGFRHLVPEYKINLVDIHDQNPELFQTEWKDIIRVMNHSRKKKELKKYMEEHKEELCRLSVDTREFLAILLDQYDILEDGRVEVKDVCKAWDGAMMMYKEEGIQQANRQTTQNMYRRGYSAEDAAALVQESVETVKRWYSEFANE